MAEQIDVYPIDSIARRLFELKFGKARVATEDEIRKLLVERDGFYARAAATLETSGKTVKQTLQELRKALS